VEKLEKKGSMLENNKYLEKIDKTHRMITEKGINKMKTILKDCKVQIELKPYTNEEGDILYHASLNLQNSDFQIPQTNLQQVSIFISIFEMCV
jgi:hypothetical protein